MWENTERSIGLASNCGTRDLNQRDAKLKEAITFVRKMVLEQKSNHVYDFQIEISNRFSLSTDEFYYVYDYLQPIFQPLVRKFCIAFLGDDVRECNTPNALYILF